MNAWLLTESIFAILSAMKLTVTLKQVAAGEEIQALPTAQLTTTPTITALVTERVTMRYRLRGCDVLWPRLRMCDVFKKQKTCIVVQRHFFEAAI